MTLGENILSRRRMLTKSTDWQSVEKARKQGNFASGKICRRRRLDLTIPKGSANPPQGSKLASKGAYMDVSDRRMQVQLTQEAKIASVFLYIRAIFAFVGFVSALGSVYPRGRRSFFVPKVTMYSVHMRCLRHKNSGKTAFFRQKIQNLTFN